MRAGSLRNRVQVVALSAELERQAIGCRSVGIRTKEGGDVPAASGLRSPALVEVRARVAPLFVAGRYLLHGTRMLHITSVRPFKEAGEVVMSCADLVGECAEYRPADAAPRACRVFLMPSAPFKDELGQVIDYRLRAEVALIETGRVQVGDQLRVGGRLYTVFGIAGGSDDGVVRGLWLDLVE